MSWLWRKKASKTEEEDEYESGSSGSYENDDDDGDSEDYSDDGVEHGHATDAHKEEKDIGEGSNVDADRKSSPPSPSRLPNNGRPQDLNGHNSSSPKDISEDDKPANGSSTSMSGGGGGGGDAPEYPTSERQGVMVETSPPTLESVRSTGQKSHLSASTASDGDDDDDVSMIESDGLHSGDEGYLDSTDEDDGGVSEDDDDDDDDDEDSSLEDEETADGLPEADREEQTSVSVSAAAVASNNEVVRVETVDENESDSDDREDEESQDDEEEEEEEEGPTSFWEKQSLLALAAEHDRVDILKGILSDEDQDASALMNSGIPPLHIAISFGSTNTTQSLLRMGANPSIRPNVAEVKQQAKEAPEGSKLEIPNMGRFDGVSAWELAFGNASYEEHQKNRSSWSMFNSSSSLSTVSMSPSSNNRGGGGGGGERIIKPCDMAPSKREGIRHAFTAEALRCIGGDEVDRLEQLLNSGMPASIDIGGKDLYDWAVQLGGLRCEEFLRPTEAAKHGTDVLSNIGTSKDGDDVAPNSKVQKDDEPSTGSTGKVLDRPGDDMTVSGLINRLDELESLASALSTCLDNLAEEVSVCHGLLLMGGGASALASHVKSLKAMQDHKQTQLIDAYAEWEDAADELSELVKSSGAIGQEVIAMAPTSVVRHDYSRTESFRKANKDDGDGNYSSSENQRQQLLAQIAASENKILKLRASIADLSEENAKEMEQVEKRGLSGGINLVRTLREELRDLEFQWNETKNRTATCRAQIGMIHSRLPKHEIKSRPPTVKSSTPPPTSRGTEGSRKSFVDDQEIVMVGRAGENEFDEGDDDAGHQSVENATSKARAPPAVSMGRSRDQPAPSKGTSITVERPGPALPGHVEMKRKDAGPATQSAAPSSTNTPESQRIATGDSQALIVRPFGKRGYFTVDLWNVLLRIIGLDQAANRRAVQVAQKQKGSTANVMIV